MAYFYLIFFSPYVCPLGRVTTGNILVSFLSESWAETWSERHRFSEIILMDSSSTAESVRTMNTSSLLSSSVASAAGPAQKLAILYNLLSRVSTWHYRRVFVLLKCVKSFSFLEMLPFLYVCGHACQVLRAVHFSQIASIDA